MSGVKNFEDLDVWKRGCQLAVDVCVAFNKSKDFALKDQVCRSSLSISSNIAEGNERDSTADYIRFLRIAKGSCGELRTQLFIAQKARKTLGLPGISNMQGLVQETKRNLSHAPSSNQIVTKTSPSKSITISCDLVTNPVACILPPVPLK